MYERIHNAIDARIAEINIHYCGLLGYIEDVARSDTPRSGASTMKCILRLREIIEGNQINDLDPGQDPDPTGRIHTPFHYCDKAFIKKYSAYLEHEFGIENHNNVKTDSIKRRFIIDTELMRRDLITYGVRSIGPDRNVEVNWSIDFTKALVGPSYIEGMKLPSHRTLKESRSSMNPCDFAQRY